AFHEGFQSLRQAMLQALTVFPPPDKARKTSVSGQRMTATSMLSTLLRQHPAVAPLVSPDVLDAGLAAGAALRLVESDLKGFLPVVQGPARLAVADAWTDASSFYGLAKVLAKSDTNMAGQLAPVRNALKKGKLTVTAAATVDHAARKAAAAQQRADKAQQRALAATQSHARAVAAHAANHKVTGSSSTPVANPQGPAASATVNPQGPSR